MQLYHFGVSLDFHEITAVDSVPARVHRTLTGRDTKPSQTYDKQGVRVQLAEEKIEVEWRSDWCRFKVEQMSDLAQCVERVLSLLDLIHSVEPINKVSVKRIDTRWILPTPNYEFDSLERKYRQVMMVDKEEIFRGIWDCSVFFNAKVGDYNLLHQSGPMGLSQLRQDFSTFEPEGLPEVFLFMLAGLSDTDVVQCSYNELGRHLMTLANHCKSHSDAFHRIWEGVL